MNAGMSMQSSMPITGGMLCSAVFGKSRLRAEHKDRSASILKNGSLCRTPGIPIGIAVHACFILDGSTVKLA
jgi:hypothetical protein